MWGILKNKYIKIAKIDYYTKIDRNFAERP